MLAAPFSTVARALNRLGLGRLLNLEPKPPVQRYERETPGDLIHIDGKKLARFREVGHRITGNRQRGSLPGVNYLGGSSQLRRRVTAPNPLPWQGVGPRCCRGQLAGN